MSFAKYKLFEERYEEYEVLAVALQAEKDPGEEGTDPGEEGPS